MRATYYARYNRDHLCSGYEKGQSERAIDGLDMKRHRYYRPPVSCICRTEGLS